MPRQSRLALTCLVSDDDFEEQAPQGAAQQRARAERERAEHTRAADMAVANGAPERRPARAAAAAANAAMDDLHARGQLV